LAREGEEGGWGAAVVRVESAKRVVRRVVWKSIAGERLREDKS